MALVAQVSLGPGTDVLHTIEIKRRGPYEKVTTDESINRYIVRVDDRSVGHVKHRYGNSAMTLLALAVDRWREDRAGMRDPFPDA